MTKQETDQVIVDGKTYSVDGLTDNAKNQINNVKFCDEMIIQLKSEWAVADTARLAYLNALRES